MRMKRTVISLGIVAVFVAAALIAVPWLMSREDVKDRVAQQLSEITGKPVLLKGDGSVSLWPFLNVTYDDVVFGGELTLADLPPLVRMDRLEARLSFTSALLGNAKLTQATLIRPRFHLQINDQGTANWSLNQGKLAGRLNVIGDEQRETLSLGNLRVVDGIADYVDFGTDASAQLTAINGTLSWPDTTSSGSADFTAVWRGEVVKLTVDAASPFDLLRGQTSQLTTSFISQPLNFSYSGELTLGTTRTANGRMSAICPSPRRLLEWIGQSIPAATNIPSTFVEGDITAAGSTIEFQNATVRVGEHEGSGRLLLQRGEKVPAINGTLAFDTLRLPNPASLALQPPGATPSGKLDLSFMDGFGLDLRLSAENAMLGPFDVTKLAASAIVRNGEASFEIGDAQALGGNMAGSISVSRGRGSALFATDLSLQTVDLEQLSGLYGPAEMAVTGTGNADIRLRSSGTSTQGLLINLEGDGAIDSAGGSIRGIDLADLPLDVTGAAEGPETPFSGSTAYEALSIKFSIVNGSAFLDGSSMKGETFTVSLGGQVDLRKRSLALQGQINSSGNDKPTGAPFFVGGSTTAPLFVMLPKNRLEPLKSE